LSIYTALKEHLGESEKALEQVDLLFRAAFFKGLLPGIHLLNLLPNPFIVVKPVLKRMTAGESSPGSMEIIEDSPDTYAVNVYQCFIHDTLLEFGAGELTTLFCSTDDWLSEALPKIQWKRTQTLGRDGDCCDFNWCRKQG
jgi:hypothetical protein